MSSNFKYLLYLCPYPYGLSIHLYSPWSEEIKPLDHHRHSASLYHHSVGNTLWGRSSISDDGILSGGVSRKSEIQFNMDWLRQLLMF